jgi:hypothetical protein
MLTLINSIFILNLKDLAGSQYQDLIISMNLVKYIITSPYYLGKQIYTSYIERKKYKVSERKDGKIIRIGELIKKALC